MYKDSKEHIDDAADHEMIKQCESHPSDTRVQQICAILERILQVSGQGHQKWVLSIFEAPGNRQDDWTSIE